MWPAEWRVFLYCGLGLPREAIRRGRRSMPRFSGSAALGGFGMSGLGVEHSSTKHFMS